jgi:hypothetical protein
VKTSGVSATEIVTATVAVSGLLLSIYNTIQANRDKRPRLRVHLSFGFLTYGPQLSDQKVFIEVGNPWTASITVTSLHIPLPDKKSMVLLNLDGEKKMPVELLPGTSARLWIGAEELKTETIKASLPPPTKFKVIASDALGNHHSSNKVSFKRTG